MPYIHIPAGMPVYMLGTAKENHAVAKIVQTSGKTNSPPLPHYNNIKHTPVSTGLRRYIPHTPRVPVIKEKLKILRKGD